MTQIIKPEKNRVEIADIFHKHIGDYRNDIPYGRNIAKSYPTF